MPLIFYIGSVSPTQTQSEAFYAQRKESMEPDKILEQLQNITLCLLKMPLTPQGKKYYTSRARTLMKRYLLATEPIKKEK